MKQRVVIIKRSLSAISLLLLLTTQLLQKNQEAEIVRSHGDGPETAVLEETFDNGQVEPGQGLTHVWPDEFVPDAYAGIDRTEGGQELTLVWSDEFNVDGPPNPENWIFEEGFVRNNELQWYQPENARVENGHLVIEGRRERVPNPDYDPESSDWRENREYAEYTSASLQTRGRYSRQYGRFEMRAKIDTREGLWPAFWTLGISGRWPLGGEVDIMEYYEGVILANAAWGLTESRQPHWDTVRIPVSDFEEGWEEDFHIWRMDWDESSIRISVDGRLLNEIDLAETVNPDGSNPFHQPHYILVNLAIGGHAGGDPSNTTFPSRYEIDYIRVYE